MSSSPATQQWTVTIYVTHHYDIELKQWIPSARVVDPFAPLPLPLPMAFALLRGPDCLHLPRRTELSANTIALSTFAGDDHLGYAGGYRLIRSVDFDWNGLTQSIQNVATTGDVGLTIRFLDITYTRDGRRVTGQCVAATGRAKPVSLGTAAGDSFDLRSSGANPLVPTAPTSDAELHGSIDDAGRISLNYTTDLFPSYGSPSQKTGR